MKAALSGVLALCLIACGSGGRDGAGSRAAEPPAGQAGPAQPEILVDPLGEALLPLGLGFRVLTRLGPEGEVRESHGVDLLPLLIDVDGDLTTGLAGADIAVQVGALSFAYALEVRVLPNAPRPLPLRLEAEFSDPLQLLTGSGGEFILMGYDASHSDAPGLFREAVLLAELPEAVLGLQSATLEITVEEPGEALTALGGTFSQAGEQRRERLSIAVDMQPPPPVTRVEALFGEALGGGNYRLSSSAASRFEVQLRSVDEQGVADGQRLLLDRIDGAISLQLDEAAGTRLDFSADQRSAFVEFEAARPGREILASLAPLPRRLSACLGPDDACGSHGGGTQSSLSFQADEPVLLNYRAQQGEAQALVEDMIVQALAVDFGASGSFRKGYVWFDTDDQLFQGRVRREDPRRGFDLRFGPQTQAQDRLVTWKNYIQTDRREGSMRCPGGADLALKIDGRFYDADFVVDTLCQ